MGQVSVLSVFSVTRKRLVSREFGAQCLYFTQALSSNVHSALMTLRWPHLQLSQADARLQLARDALDNAAHSAADVARLYLTSNLGPSQSGDTSPFILPWFYMSGIRCIETKAEIDLELLEAALDRLRCKWKAAGMSTSKHYYSVVF
jgi:hypothetical protein